MCEMTCLGIFCIGFVFGYLLLYAVRHTQQFNIDMLQGAIGAVSGGAIVKFLGNAQSWLGPYGAGLGAGFLVYGVLSVILINKVGFKSASDEKVKYLCQALLNKPKE